MNQIRQIVDAAAANAETLVQVAQGCRASNLTALQCCPELFTLYPTTIADDMASAMIQVWGCELSSSDLTTALTSCQTSPGVQAYTAAQITTAISDNLSLTFLDCKNVPTQYGSSVNSQLKMIGLSQGNLVTIKPAEGAEFLVISCLPGDYTPTSGTVLGALKSTYGIDVGALAQNKAADYRSADNCWISQPLPANVPYQRLIVFESTGSNAVSNVPGIFAGLKAFVPNPPQIPNTGATILSAMLSTGDAGASATAILTALYNGAYGLMTGGAGYNLTCFRIINFHAGWNSELTTTFDALKNQ
jgi:hypothetical protein